LKAARFSGLIKAGLCLHQWSAGTSWFTDTCCMHGQYGHAGHEYKKLMIPPSPFYIQQVLFFSFKCAGMPGTLYAGESQEVRMARVLKPVFLEDFRRQAAAART